MSLLPGELRDLAHRLSEYGPAAVEAELVELARLAAAAGTEPVLLAVMCDRREATVIRQRAFARVAAQLDRLSRPTPPDTEVEGDVAHLTEHLDSCTTHAR